MTALCLNFRRWPVLAAMFLMVASPAVASAQVVHREQLPNGLTLIIDDRADTHAVEVRVHVAAGPLYEGDLLGTGVSAVVREMLMEAVRGGRLAIDQHLVADGLRSTISTSGVSYAWTTTDQHIAEGLEALASLVTWRNDDADVALEARARVLQQVVARNSDAAQFEHARLAATVFRRHPARVPVAGLLPLVSALDAAAIAEYHRQRYTAPNVTAIVVGNVDPVAVRAAVAEIFAELPTGGWFPEPEILEPPQYQDRHALIAGPVAQERHAYAWQTVALADRDQAGLAVVAELLAGPEGSLVQAFAENQAASQVNIVNHDEPNQPGWFRVSYTPFPGKAADAWLTLESVLSNLAQEGPDLAHLTAAKKRLLRRFIADRARVAHVAESLEIWEREIAVPNYGEIRQTQLEQVDSDAVRRVAERWLQPNSRQRSRVVIKPALGESEAPPLSDHGLALSDVPPTLINDLPGGVRCFYRRAPLGLAHLRLTLSGGVAAEDRAYRGVSRVLARVLADGTQNRFGSDFQTLLSDTGMALRTRSDAHAVEVMISCFPEDVTTAVDTLVDLLKRPALTEAAVTRAVQDVQSEMAFERSDEDWGETLLRAVRRSMLGNHYAAADWRGTRDTLAAIDRSILQVHHSRLTTGRRVIFGLAGEIDMEPTLRHLRERLAAEPQIIAGDTWQPSAGGKIIENEPFTATITWDRAQTGAVALAWPGPGFGNIATDGPALDVAAALLLGNGGGGGFIAQSLNAGGLSVHDFDITQERYAGTGLWVLRALVDDAQRLAVTERLRAVVVDLSRRLALPVQDADAITDDVLAAARARCIARRALRQEDPIATQQAQSHAIAFGIGLEQQLAYRARVEAVTRSDLQRVLSSYLGQTPGELRLVSASQPVEVVPVVVEPDPEPVAGEPVSEEASALDDSPIDETVAP